MSQDIGDALYDLTAASMMHLLGNALLVPYYRCSEVFSEDQTLDARFRNALLRLTRAELEQSIKRYLYADGYNIDLSGPALTLADRAVVALEMRHRSLEFNDENLVEFAFQLWKNLDFSKAAEIIDRRLAHTVRAKREQLAANASSSVAAADTGSRPVHSESARLVVLDLSRVAEIEAREKIIAAARDCAGCDDLRSDPAKTRIAIQISSEPWELQRALRRNPARYEYRWTDISQQRMIVMPQ